MKYALILLVVSAGLVAAGCGSTAEDGSTAASGAEPSAPPPAPAASLSKERLPKALAANRAEANQILEEGSLDAKLEDLRGHPVVVNQWASWCPPCREEFPFFRASAEAHADTVAFVGIDMQDAQAAAETFLAEQPVPYPSVFDPDAEQIRSLGGGVVSPTTVFIDASGEVVSTFQGAYVSQDQLDADIDRFLLG